MSPAPKSDSDRVIRQSVLDRLIDLDRATAVDPPSTWGQSVRQLKNTLCRDLEWLLNTRRPLVELPEGCENLESSLLLYGITDVSSIGRENLDQQAKLVKEVERAVSTFEPRLANVRVSIAAAEQGAEGGPIRELRFIVEGLLRIDPEPEQVVFDTVLEVSTGDYHVRSDGSA
jgi:type VI secretion system protein ImpF